MTIDIVERERLILDRLRETFEHQGYEFFAAPLPDMLPLFLKGFRPDAIALKEGDCVVIEVKHGHKTGQNPQLESLAKLIAAQPGWRLQVYFENGRAEETLQISKPNQAQIEASLREAEQLAAAGHRQAAMLLTWSVLEAVARARAARDGASAQRPFSSTQAIQLLQMAGLIESSAARDLLAKAQLRNLIAHGDLSADIGADDLIGFIKFVRGLSVAPEQAVAQ